MVRSSEHDNGSPDSTKGKEFLGYMGNYWLPKEKSASWS
jgi:hypothetical protein